MKKIISILLAMLMLATVALSAVSCGEEDGDNHTHAFKNGICDCGEVNPDYRTCFACGLNEGTEPLEYYGYTVYLCVSCYNEYTHKHEFVDGKCECGEEDPDYGKTVLSSATVDENGNLIITLSDGSVFPGVALPENKEGIKFKEAKLEDGDLVITFTDGYMVGCRHLVGISGEITSLNARIEKKHLYLTINDSEQDLGQVFYPTMPLEELTPSGSCDYADSRDVTGRDITYVEIKVKGYGIITVLLDATTAPITVANFLSLVEAGFYDGLTFHRVMSNFMIQGGDPKGDGTGGSGTEIKGEMNENGWVNDILHKRGVISMARRSDSMDSATSQFFITNVDAHASLDGKYAAFGYVVCGMNIIDEITNLSLPYADSYSSYTIPDKTKQVVIESIKIHEHSFSDGECYCGAKEQAPNPDTPVDPPHEHNFVEGKCECGESDPSYVAPHEHNFVEGKCECGEIDQNYKPGGEDTYYDPNGWTKP